MIEERSKAVDIERKKQTAEQEMVGFYDLYIYYLESIHEGKD